MAAPRNEKWLRRIARSLREPSARPWVIVVLVLMITSIAWLDWSTGPGREPSDLYDVPILLSAGVFGLPGVIVAASVSSVLYCLTLWYQRVPFSVVDVSQVILFFVLGTAVSQLVTEFLRADDLRRELQHSNARLSQRVAEAVAAEREAQQKLRDGQRLMMLGQAAAMIAHEIKNPLVAIGGFTSRTQRQLPRDHWAQSGLRIVVQEVIKLEALLKGLLDLGSPGCQGGRSCDLGVLVEEVLALVQPHVQAHKLQLVPVFPREPLAITGDTDQLKRALLNVILNGVEAMPEGGKLGVTVCSAARGDEPGASIVVQDTGKGISAENLSRIFEPFFTTKQGGTGLGLALVKKTIDAHGGTVRIESLCSKGTVVTMWLPLTSHERGSDAGVPQTA